MKSPNPAFAGVDVPLASSFILSTKKGKESYVVPVTESGGYRFTVKAGNPPEGAENGTKSGGSGSSFLCLLSGVPMPFDYLRSEAKAGRMGARMMAIVAEGDRGRVYLAPTPEQETVALGAVPKDPPETNLPERALGFRVQEYGMVKWRDLFTDRQLVALSTFSVLVGDCRERIMEDAVAAGMVDDGRSMRDAGQGMTAYAEAVGVYLAFALSKQADLGNSLCRWEPNAQCPRQLFGRQAIPMVWDYAEGNPLGDSSGAWKVFVEGIVKAFSRAFGTIEAYTPGYAQQADAASQGISRDKVISTDPPYYDNIGYADLSDFFYVWLRRSLGPVFSDLFSTLAVPKTEELVAAPYRHGSKENAEAFFLKGMTEAMRQLANQTHSIFPVTIYYAFKQTETRDDNNISSTGWETFLGAVIKSGLGITGTWPIRTENKSRLVGQDTNALASSTILVCRPLPVNAPAATLREFIDVLKADLPEGLRKMQAGNIAPVDLAQAAIGPGMAVFTRYARVLDASGAAVTVREALSLINDTLDEVLAEQEGEFDADTRWALAWFERSGFDPGDFGVAETLSKAKNTSVAGMVEAGIVRSGAGKVSLLRPNELSADWNPDRDSRRTAWESVHHLVGILNQESEGAAAALLSKLGSDAETVRDLAYRLYRICDQKNRPQEALGYNALVRSWGEISELASRAVVETQATMFDQE